MKNKFLVEESIILAGSLFGSIYLFGTCLNILSDLDDKKKITQFYFKVINGLTIGFSGALFLLCCKICYKQLN